MTTGITSRSTSRDRRRAVRAGLCRALVVIPLLAAGRPVPAVDDQIVGEAAADQEGQRQPHMLDLGMNFDANLFEHRGNSWVVRGGPAPPPAAERPPEPLALSRGREMGLRRLERIEAACGIAAEQKRRLVLAVESDVRRFVAEVETTRERYAGHQINMNEPAGQREWHSFQQDVKRCRDQLRDLFDRGSLFATVLTATLDDGQRTCLATEIAARRSFHWRAMVLEATSKLDDSLGLDQRQHDALVKELLSHEPALRTEADMLARDDVNLRRSLVLMVMSECDASRIRAAVSDQQWRMLAVLINQGKAMRSWIEQQGVIEGKP
ncbi:MAG: hypothetical protein FJ284_02475 [Planctomycetes bacterium]|nr:hypothetical protein [Planctomycetota bacterium]